jgi:hypothetical protein
VLAGIAYADYALDFANAARVVFVHRVALSTDRCSSLVLS